jgi:hypothetical protein
MMIAFHLLMCRQCSRFRKQLLIIRNAIGQKDQNKREADAAPALPPETRMRIKKAMKDFAF